MATRNTLTTSRFSVLAPALAVTVLLTLGGCSGKDEPKVAGFSSGATGDSTLPPGDSAQPSREDPTPTQQPSKKPTPSRGAKSVNGNATLSWQAPTERADGTVLNALSGYRIVYGTQSRKYRRSIRLTNPGLTRYYIDKLGAATWYFAIIAIDAQGMESAPSTEVSKKIG